MKEAKANSTLSRAGLTPSRQEREVTDPAQDGVVLEQRPGAGSEVDKGSQVVIVIGILKQDDTLAPTPTTP
jgi:beta-lactam-binding protein with PASTA domain